MTRLEYEAYAPMAAREMERVCQGVREKWSDVHAVAVHHRQ